jgi:hypothetical protein
MFQYAILTCEQQTVKLTENEEPVTALCLSRCCVSKNRKVKVTPVLKYHAMMAYRGLEGKT